MGKAKTALLSCLLPMAAIILECLPGGAVLHIASGPYDTVERRYPYFSLTPFGYANFGPLIAAALTAVTLILGILYVMLGKDGLSKAQKWISAAGFAASLLPAIMFGAKSFTGIGAAISVLLLLQSVIGFSVKRTGT